jgi:hypothetical protein
MRLSRLLFPKEPSTYKRPLGTKLGTIANPLKAVSMLLPVSRFAAVFSLLQVDDQTPDNWLFSGG